MQKHYAKKIIAGFLTAAMVIPTTVIPNGTINASASELLGETSFDYKILPWHTVEANPARQYFDIDDGAAHIMIQVPQGADKEKWDLQFRHRNLSFKANHEYKVSFKAKSKREGFELCSKIGNLRGDEEYFELDGMTNDMHMGPDMGGQWPGCAVKLSTEWQEYEGIFTPIRDIDAAEWTFQYARGTMYQGNAQEGDEIWFDEMSIFDLTEDSVSQPVYSYGYTSRGFSGLENNYISVNQLGYYQGLDKIATLGDNYGDITHEASVIKLDGKYTYEIVDASTDKVVYTGSTDAPVKDDDSGDKICRIDFTEFDEPGEYYLRIKGKEWRSFPFKIGNDIYGNKENNMLTNALNYFYQNRSGTDIEAKYITSGDKENLAHSYNRDEAAGFVMKKWQNSYGINPNYIETISSSKLNTSGGWFTGTEYEKQMLDGGVSVWTLQNMYERAIQNEKGVEKFADGSGTVVIPENGNKIPDILDECRYELEFMYKMKVSPDEKTWGEYAGLYYNSIQGVGFEANSPDYEHEYHAACIVRPPTLAATLNYAACAAQGARLWKQYDEKYAEELMKRAKEAYEAYKTYWYKPEMDEEHNEKSLYAPMYDWRYSAGDPEEAVKADDYWAACELYITAKDMDDPDAGTYLSALTNNKNAFDLPRKIKGGSNEIGDGTLTFFNSSNPAAAGSMSLLINNELLTDEQKDKLKESLLYTADYYLYAENAQGYGIPYMYDGPGYDLPMGYAFNTRNEGFEKDSNKLALNNLFAMAYAYDLTGETKYLNGITRGMDYLLGNNPLSYSYITGYGSYHVNNPSHRYWQYEADKSLPQAPDGVIVCGPTSEVNDPYSRALGMKLERPYDSSERFYADSIEAWSTNETSACMNASLAWVVSFLQDEEETKPEPVDTSKLGDVNDDGEFDISDLITFQAWLLGNEHYTLDNWKAADFCNDGKLDVFDLTRMKKELINKKAKGCVIPDVQVKYGTPLVITEDGLGFYLGPDESYETIAKIPDRTRLSELGYMNDNKEWLFTEYKGKYGWIRNVNDEGEPTLYYEEASKKPVIYLYPEEETDVHVELELTESELSTTYPKYNNGWDVTASPDGTLLNKADGTHHKYLFWDSTNCRTRFDFSKGFCVAGSDTESFLREKLTYMGLTEEEMNEFIVYWLPLMEHNKYNLIAFQSDAYTNSAKLNITPEPDSICRVFMAYVPLENAVDIQPQQLETFERKGFTVVEWGGSEVK